MTEKRKPTRTSGADPGPERIVEDGRLGLARLAEFTKRILKMPKADPDETHDPRPTT